MVAIVTRSYEQVKKGTVEKSSAGLITDAYDYIRVKFDLKTVLPKSATAESELAAN